MKNITNPPITAKESRQIVKEMNEDAESLASRFLDWHEREGWRPLGYRTLDDCIAAKELSFLTSRAQAFRLMNKAEVEEQTGTQVPMMVAQEISKLPPEQQKPALEAATAASNGKPTVAAAKAAVAAVPPKPEVTPAKPTKATEHYETALERIKQVCGQKTERAIRDKSLSNVNPKSAIFWAGLKDASMREIEELVVTKRWKPEAARKFLDKVPGEKSTIADLQLLAITNAGATMVVTGGYATICFHWRARRDEYGKIRKLLGLDK